MRGCGSSRRGLYSGRKANHSASIGEFDDQQLKRVSTSISAGGGIV